MSFKKQNRGQLLHFASRCWPSAIAFTVWCTTCMVYCLPLGAQQPATFGNTLPLKMEGDIASQMVAGVDKFLLNELANSIPQRPTYWNRDTSSTDSYTQSIELNRKAFARMIGVRDARHAQIEMELVSTTDQSSIVGRGLGYKIHTVRWPVMGDITGEGLLVTPDGPPVANLVAIPDADQIPEMLVGLREGVPLESQYVRMLVNSRCRVVIPLVVSRARSKRNGRAVLTNREYVYRSAFELGRHVIGYEVQKVLAAIDWFDSRDDGDLPTGVVGWGEGGLLALYSAAVDPRIDVTCVSGYFDSRQSIWLEPIDRNVFGLLEQFGDAEVASLIAPRRLIVEAAEGPVVNIPGEGGAPARLESPQADVVAMEVERATVLTRGLADWISLRSLENPSKPLTSETISLMLQSLVGKAGAAPRSAPPTHLVKKFDPVSRQRRQWYQMDRHNQWLLRESPYARAEFMKNVNTESMDQFQASIEPYRTYFREQVIGEFNRRLLPPKPRTRQVYDTDHWVGYEVVMDVFPDVFAYGILLWPKNIAADEKRPVVVCQHGLEGRPNDTIEGDHRAYHDFAAKLADQGFIVFAPQNLYIFRDRFRTLQRKANPLKKTLFSIMVPQHRQITNWLATLPQVDPERIAFYGLSYGGKSAMRIPPLVDRYCLSICSADFNDWVWKNASTRARYSYVWTGEYEIFEFDLGSTFNYAEMAALIAPRPFMVERGHFDGVAPDETVGYEFAKVRNLYQAKLGIGDRCEIEWFAGPHTINGQGTFAFLKKHLDWPSE